MPRLASLNVPSLMYRLLVLYCLRRYAGLGLQPGAKGLPTDVCVPISRLSECILETQKDIKEIGAGWPIVGHVGDGNFHVLCLFDPESDSELEKVKSFNARLVRRALAMGGTCTGEHGMCPLTAL